MSSVFGLKKFMSHIGQKSDRMTQNFLSIGEKNQGLAKEGEIEMSPFYVEGDKFNVRISRRPSEYVQLSADPLFRNYSRQLLKQITSDCDIPHVTKRHSHVPFLG
jgi:hypothetical protein